MRAGVGAKWMDGSGLIAVQTGVYPIGDCGDAVYSGCHVLAESDDGMKFRFDPRDWILIRSSTEWRIVELEEKINGLTHAVTEAELVISREKLSRDMSQLERLVARQRSDLASAAEELELLQKEREGYEDI